MRTRQPGIADPQTAAGGQADALLQREIARGNMLKSAFRLCIERRPDTGNWLLVEGETAVLLERSRRAGQEAPQRFAEANRKLESSISNLLRKAAPKNGRADTYRSAVKQVFESALAWSALPGHAGLAYWQHRTLVWTALWHTADLPTVTAEQAKECLSFAVNPSVKADEAFKLAAQGTLRARVIRVGRFLAPAFGNRA